MGRLNIHEVIQAGIVRCPSCAGALSVDRENLQCLSCSHQYPIVDNSPLLLPPRMMNEETKLDIQTFWGELYRKAYADHDRKISQAEFRHLLLDLERLFGHREHLATTEMPVDQLQGKRVLEIGSGAGAHSVFFASKGARIVSLDLTLDRVVATAQKLDLLALNNENFCLQGDAETLPFADNSFDIVYSNGVLHHTPNTNQTIREIYRVLKPEGKAVIMLYAKNSYLYWVNMFLLKGIFLGHMFRRKNWRGHVTEWMANENQKLFNPETKVYSKKEVIKLFSNFKRISIRKNSFTIQQIPFIGKSISWFLGKKTGVNPAGNLLYGQPWRNETSWELNLGKRIGFGLNILAIK